MSGWNDGLGLIAAGAVLAELAQSLAPDGWKERIGRIAALAVLASLVLRFFPAVGAGERIADAAAELIARGTESGAETEGGREAWIGAAGFAFAYLRELGLDADGAEVTVETGEGEETQILVTVPHCPYAELERIGKELGAALGVRVRAVTGKERGA